MNENLMFFPNKSRITTNTNTINTHIIKLWGDIGIPCEYQDEIDLIDSAGPDDVIVLDLCTDGGVMDTAALFNRALRSTAAHTVAVIGPSCASAGSIIALSCREFVIDNTSSLMLHTSSYGFGRSKDVDIFEHANFSRKSLRRLYEDVYSGFISKDQLEDVIKGQPFYFDCDELEERLDALHEYRSQLAQACECGECGTEGDEDQPFDLMSLIEEKVEQGVDKALKKLYSKFDLTPKPPKERRPKTAKSEEIVFDGIAGKCLKAAPLEEIPPPPAEK